MLPPELRRSCGMLPGTDLLCTSCLCTGLRKRQLLPGTNLLCTVGSAVLCSSGLPHERLLPGRAELLRSCRSGMLCSRRLCSCLRQRLCSFLPR